MTQPAFFGAKVLLSFDDSDLLIERADLDRQVIFTRTTDTVLFSFTEFTPPAPGTGTWAQWTPASQSQQLSFVLPAAHEFWAGHSSDGQQVTLSFLVTKALIVTG